MNPNTYTQPTQKSYAMAHGGDVGVVIQLNQKCAVAQAGSVGMGRKLNQKYAIARAGDVEVVFQPKQKSRLVADACGVGMNIQLTKGHAMAYSRGVGVDQPTNEACQVTRACRIGMDFGSTE